MSFSRSAKLLSTTLIFILFILRLTSQFFSFSSFIISFNSSGFSVNRALLKYPLPTFQVFSFPRHLFKNLVKNCSKIFRKDVVTQATPFCNLILRNFCVARLYTYLISCFSAAVITAVVSIESKAFNTKASCAHCFFFNDMNESLDII